MCSKPSEMFHRGTGASCLHPRQPSKHPLTPARPAPMRPLVTSSWRRGCLSRLQGQP